MRGARMVSLQLIAPRRFPTNTRLQLSDIQTLQSHPFDKTGCSSCVVGILLQGFGGETSAMGSDGRWAVTLADASGA